MDDFSIWNVCQAGETQRNQVKFVRCHGHCVEFLFNPKLNSKQFQFANNIRFFLVWKKEKNEQKNNASLEKGTTINLIELYAPLMNLYVREKRICLSFSAKKTTEKIN